MECSAWRFDAPTGALAASVSQGVEQRLLDVVLGEHREPEFSGQPGGDAGLAAAGEPGHQDEEGPGGHLAGKRLH